MSLYWWILCQTRLLQWRRHDDSWYIYAAIDLDITDNHYQVNYPFCWLRTHFSSFISQNEDLSSLDLIIGSWLEFSYNLHLKNLFSSFCWFSRIFFSTFKKCINWLKKYSNIFVIARVAFFKLFKNTVLTGDANFSLLLSLLCSQRLVNVYILSINTWKTLI